MAPASAETLRKLVALAEEFRRPTSFDADDPAYRAGYDDGEIAVDSAAYDMGYEAGVEAGYKEGWADAKREKPDVE